MVNLLPRAIFPLTQIRLPASSYSEAVSLTFSSDALSGAPAGIEIGSLLTKIVPSDAINFVFASKSNLFGVLL